MTKKEERLLNSMRKFILNEIQITISDITERKCMRKSKDTGLVIAAHVVALYQAMLSALVYGRKLRGQFKEVRNHFNLDGRHKVIRTVAEDSCVVISEYLSTADPEYDYQLQIVRRPKEVKKT